MKVYFDVGANNGSWGINKVYSEDCIVYAFEPTPELCQKIKLRCSHPNYHLIPKAVGLTPGKANFNVQGLANWGCSSLLEFKSEEELAVTWPGVEVLKKTHSIEVDVIRMDDFCMENNIQRIDFFHCDTQGNDLNVLKSFGDYISIVEAGEIETCSFSSQAIYVNQDSTIQSCLEFFRQVGLKALHINANDIFGNEYNMIFKKTLDLSELHF